MTTVALLGASGFVGSEVRLALERRGSRVISIAAPRLSTSVRDLDALGALLTEDEVASHISDLARALQGCDVVVNAAGLATATGGGDDLFGANSLLPGVVAQAVAPGARFVHVSSAAVQGRRKCLDETTYTEPFSPYSLSKALGEQLATRTRPATVLYRPTSVHGTGRRVTQSLVRVLASPAACVAAPGEDPTPQALVANVADALAFLALTAETPPGVVLHPWEGLTTSELVRVVGRREPHLVPRSLAKALVAAGNFVGRWSGAVAGVARRAEMLLFGQRQSRSWLQGRWTPVVDRQKWKELA